MQMGSRPCASTTPHTSHWRENVGSESSWTRPPGGRTRTGALGSATRPRALADINRRGVALLEELREEGGDRTLVISGCVGPRGDGYRVDDAMDPDEAERYHSAQIRTLADTTAELVTAYTLTYAGEAIGVVRAAQAAGIPSVVSFTVETDGRLPDGRPLGEAVLAVDEATDAGAAYFMINCAHPTHFEDVLEGQWLKRVRGIRANASSKSHAELDESTDLDSGDPAALAAHYAALRPLLPELTVVGGCCGTDMRHIREICAVWTG
jgi:S-methylmethionine-dependent homocysteine/selenocysteine methylase